MVIKLRRKGAAAAALWAALAAGAAPAGAQQLPAALPAQTLQPAGFGLPVRSASPIRFSVGRRDGALIVGLGALAVLPDLLGTRLPYAACAPCDSTALWGLDRGAVGAERSLPGRLSDGALGVTVVGAGLLLAASRRGEPGAGAATRADLAVLAQAMAADAALVQWLKVAFHRARPIRYTADAALHPGADDGRSFPSGHASVAFAAASAATGILARRHALRGRTAEVVGLFGAAALTAGLRVAARRHFPTDVMAGAVLGTAVGWGVVRVRDMK